MDDGSKDDSSAICEKYAEFDNRIKIIKQENSGASVARNRGVECATGAWIMFVDPDDYLDLKIVETLVEGIQGGIDIIACSCTVLKNGEKIQCHFYNGNKKFTCFEEKKDLFLQLLNMKHCQPKNLAYTAIGVPWRKLYRLEMLKNNRLIFNSSLKRNEDTIFNMYAFSYSNAIVYIDLPLYQYRFEHMGSYFSKYNPKAYDIFTQYLCEK